MSRSPAAIARRARQRQEWLARVHPEWVDATAEPQTEPQTEPEPPKPPVRTPPTTRPVPSIPPPVVREALPMPTTARVREPAQPKPEPIRNYCPDCARRPASRRGDARCAECRAKTGRRRKRRESPADRLAELDAVYPW